MTQRRPATQRVAEPQGETRCVETVGLEGMLCLNKTQCPSTLSVVLLPAPRNRGSRLGGRRIPAAWWTRQHASFLSTIMVLCLMSIILLPLVTAGPKQISRAEINSISPATSFENKGGSFKKKEINFDGKQSDQAKKTRNKPQMARQTTKKGQGSNTKPMPEVNLVAWNSGGLKDEAKTLLILDHIKSEWPDTHLILLTETHLEEGDTNEILDGNKDWQVFSLAQKSSQHTNWGGLILLARKGMFTVSLHKEYQEHHIDAATWSIQHASWELPLHLTGIYRNHPASRRKGGREAYINSKDTETGQLAAIEEIAETMQLTTTPELMIGDFNIAMGRAQEELQHPTVAAWGKRESIHDPYIPPSSPATQLMRIIDEQQLWILNGRYGQDSAETTYEKMVSKRQGKETTHTTIDYAICKQSMADTIKSMTVEKNNGAGVYSDHRPLRVTSLCK